MEKYHIPLTCLPEAHLGVFQLCLSTQINLQHVFKTSAFGTYACFELGTPLINECVSCLLFNAGPNIESHEQKYCNNVILTLVSGREISKQI